MSQSCVTTIDLLRHGRTTQDDILRGRVNTPLTAEGYEQMRQSLAPYTDNPPWQRIVSSPLQRCLHFAEQLGQSLQTHVHADEGFIEMDFGDWDGRPFAELRQENPELFARVWQQPHRYSPPNGETFPAFSERIASSWQSLLTQHKGEHLLLICHGGVIRALLGHILQSPLSALSRMDVPYASFSRIRVYHQPGSEDWPQLLMHRPFDSV